jgi:hypothetical protein
MNEADPISGFEFGLENEVWNGPHTYVGKVTEGMGVCIYAIPGVGAQGWLMQFFPIRSHDTEPSIKQYADWIVERASGGEATSWYTHSKDQYPFMGPFDNVCVIASMIENQRNNYRTIARSTQS